MGIFSKFLGKKNDDLGLDDFDKSFGSGSPGMNDPMGSPDFGSPMGMPPQTTPGMPGQPSSSGSYSPEAFGFEKVNQQERSATGMGSQQNLSEINLGKDMEIISAKLDAIKAELDSMSQRLKRLERLAEGDPHINKDKWSY